MRKSFNIIVYLFAIIGFVLVGVYLSVEFGFTDSRGIIDSQHDYFKNLLGNATGTDPSIANQADGGAWAQGEAGAWTQGEEWQVLKSAMIKDKTDIDKAATKSGVASRMIVASLVAEQLRLFHSNRELFKSVFAPLKILANQSQFSWGVMGVKQDTARAIENNLKDPHSPWYLGTKYEHVLDFSGKTIHGTPVDPDTERFNRLTDEGSRYFSYLYAGLYMKEVMSQWNNAGISIKNRPDIVATLYDIGFANSHPHVDPLSGGAEIDIGTTTYSFGGLAGSFYGSGELTDVFPR